MRYIPRISDKILDQRLSSKGAVLIEGPKWCGKTATVSQVAKSVLNLADLNVLEEAREIASLNTKLLLAGDTPRLIDEWQEIPRLWDAVRNEVDLRQTTGQFIFTGSAVPPEREKLLHTGTGRFSRMVMRTMSLWESGESNGSISLKDLFEGNIEMSGASSVGLEKVAELICRGGWPMAVLMSGQEALRQAVDYYDAVVNFDISRVDGVRRSPLTANKLLRSYARHIGLQSSMTTIRDDIKNGDDSIDVSTVSSY